MSERERKTEDKRERTAEKNRKECHGNHRNHFGKLFRLHSSVPIELLTKLVIDSSHYHVTHNVHNKSNQDKRRYQCEQATAIETRYHEWSKASGKESENTYESNEYGEENEE